MTAARHLRNIAIIAHVDHGKTTLVDCLLKQSGTFAAHEKMGERIMDSNAIEKERGITILAKNCAIDYGGLPHQRGGYPWPCRLRRRGGARAVDGRRRVAGSGCGRGPMPQTRFVTRKALAWDPGHRRCEQGRSAGRALRMGG